MMKTNEIDKLGISDDAKAELKYIELELEKINDASKKIEFINNYVETHEWSHHINEALLKEYCYDYIILTPSPADDFDTVKQKIYDAKPDAMKKCERVIDKAGGCIKYFKSRFPKYKELYVYNQFIHPLQILIYLTKRIDAISIEVAENIDNPDQLLPESHDIDSNRLFPGLEVKNTIEFINHLKEAEKKGFLRYNYGEKIVLTKTNNHNCLAVALYNFWLDNGYIYSIINSDWCVDISNNIFIENAKGELGKLNKKKLSQVSTERKFEVLLDELEEKFLQHEKHSSRPPLVTP